MPKPSELKCYFGCEIDGPLHKFPAWEYPSTVDKFNQWKSILDLETQKKGYHSIYDSVRLCYRHFEDKYRLPSKRLTKNAVPTLNLSVLGRSFVGEDIATQPSTSPQVVAPLDSTASVTYKLCKTQGLKIALVQLSVGPDKSKNIAEAVKEIHKAKQNGAQLVALPECFNSPYGTKYFEEYAEEVPGGATSRALSAAAAEAGVCVVGGTLPERCGGRLYNTCTVWDRCGKLLARHRKMHLFDIDIPNKITFKESEVLSAGSELSMFEYEGVKVGLGICYDLRFPEMAHLMAQQGCSLLIYPGAFNMTTGPKHWELLGRARATDQQLWVALVSPARDSGAGYVAWGHSTLVDPWGAVVDKLDEKPGTLYGNIDISTVEEVRSQIPIRQQRRTDIYDTVPKS